MPTILIIILLSNVHVIKYQPLNTSKPLFYTFTVFHYLPNDVSHLYPQNGCVPRATRVHFQTSSIHFRSAFNCQQKGSYSWILQRLACCSPFSLLHSFFLTCDHRKQSSAVFLLTSFSIVHD